MKKRILIATIKKWNIGNALKFKERFKERYDVLLITKKKDLNYARIEKFKPQYIFFPHWSWIIPQKIYDKFRCVVFHMTDLPFGRGGSPLQNLIIRGLTKTRISAVRVVKELDAGPVYSKKDLRLSGSAEDIYRKVSRIIFSDMISYIIENDPRPIPQKGKVVVFKRRNPTDSKIPSGVDLKGAYDLIRMLDADGYPHAFMETKNLRFNFKNASKKSKYVKATVTIVEKQKGAI